MPSLPSSPRAVVVRCGELRLTASLADTATADAVWDALPISGTVSRWGDELYFTTDLSADVEADACQIVDPGTLCFWPEAQIVALPFGPTPISLGEECRLAAAVNQWGRIDDDARALACVDAGEVLFIERSAA